MRSFALILLLSLAAAGQDQPARLSGVVTDVSGAPVPGSEIRLILEDGRILEIRTGNDGAFSFEVSGEFEMEASREGFRRVRTTPVALASGGSYEIEFVLLEGNASEVELVELLLQDAAAFAAAAASPAREDLPRSDRLFGLRGGINVSGIAEGSSQQWIAASGSVFAGSPTAVTLIDPSRLSAEYSPDIGVDDSLSPGGPELHGDAYYFHRNDLFNARNFFDPPAEPIPPFKYHFLGASLGGPLGRGTYASVRYWGLRIRQSVTRAATVPDPVQIGGDFSALTEPILDPETGFPFRGNIIPSARLDPQGVALARLYPAPNVAGARVQNYRAVGPLETVADAFGVRADHRLTVSDELSVEYQFSRDTTDDPFNLVTGITNLPGFGVRDSLRTQTLRAANTHVFSPSLLHQIRFSAGYLEQPRRILSEAEYPAVIVTGFSNLGHATNLPQERKNRTIRFSNEVSWTHANGAIRMGGSGRHFDFDASMDLFRRGQFQFNDGSFALNALANLLLGVPANAIRLTGDTRRNFRAWASGFYVQHDWRVRPNLQLSVGVRYDYQSPFDEADKRVANFTASGQLETSPENLYRADGNNWAPRLGIAWSPFRATVVRAGYGIFYDHLAVGDSLFLLGLNPPYVRFEVANNDPVVPRFDLRTAFDDPSSSAPPSVFSASRELANPYVQHWSLVLGRSIAPGWDATLAYVGQKGTHLRRQVNRNQPAPGSPFDLDARRPFPDFANIFQFETSASSSSHALEAGIARRLSGGLGLEASYRWARFIDDATLISILPQDSHNLTGERGLSDFHVKHRFSISGTYDLPLLDGWQVQGIGLFQSGMPLSAVLGTDVAGTGSPIVNRPHLVGDPRVDDPTPAHFFNTDAFRIPESGEFGNSGRNVIIGPGFDNVDLAVRRRFRLSDRMRAEFRADFFNAFNHPNFIAPPTTQNFADSPEFGALFVARSPRIVQLGLRVFW